MDWSTDNDYDPDNASWIDVTCAGAVWQMQIDTTKPDHYRYRRIYPHGSWLEGQPPEEAVGGQ